MKRLVGFGMSLTLFAGLAGSQGHAQTPAPGLAVSVVVDAAQYRLNTDPLKLAITIRNVSGLTLLASQGLTTAPLHLLLVFTDPDGRPIIASPPSAPNEGGPPTVLAVDGTLVQVDPVDTLSPTFVLSVEVADARAFYTFTKAGFYGVKAVVPVRTYPIVYRTASGVDYAQLDTATFGGAIESASAPFALVTDADGDGYAFPAPDARISANTVADCNDSNAGIHPGALEVPGDGADNDCNPATSDIVATAPGTIVVKAVKHSVGSGATPETKTAPLANLPVHFFDKTAGSCASQSGFTQRQAKSMWLSCTPDYSTTTDSAGNATITADPGDYYVIGEYDPDNVPQTGDEIYPNDLARNLNSGATVTTNLRVTVKVSGKAVPAKTTERTGSLLLIIEPEYIEWDGTQELYPFVFESVGDWTVTTSVSPPPGFVADRAAITTDVNTNLKAAQFTITDVGSDWVDTAVTYELKHKGKKEIIKSKIGVKLSERLAKGKGLTRLGKPLKASK
jgi:hypothetical protein